MTTYLKSGFHLLLKKFQNLRAGSFSDKRMSIQHNFRRHVLEIFDEAVKSVQPHKLVQKACQRISSNVIINERKFLLTHNVFVVGFGKAVWGMARALEDMFGEHLVSGILSVPNGTQQEMVTKTGKGLNADSKIQVLEGAANNLPDENSLRTTIDIVNLVSSLKEPHLLFVLISGGGSALLPAPAPPVTLAEKQKVVKMLAEYGATIQEMNVIRKRLSTVKGGGLAHLAKPAQVVSLILSDIIGDPLDLIASGPTVRNLDDPSLALSILQRLGLDNEVPANVISVLQAIPEDFGKEDMSDVVNVVIGSNSTAAEAASKIAEQMGYSSVIVTLSIHGEAYTVGSELAHLASIMFHGNLSELEPVVKKLELPLSSSQSLISAHAKSQAEGKDLCLIFGGETVVKVKGTGLGGRNQELALSAALRLQKAPYAEVLLLSAGTDGIDGPTTAAGAIATPVLTSLAEKQGLSASTYLKNNDSFTFFSKADGGKWHVVTGHTGTNVMDLIIILIHLKS